LVIRVSTILRRRKHRNQEQLEKVLKKDKVHVYIAGPISFAEEKQAYREAIAEGLKKISDKFVIHDPWEREKLKFGDPSFNSLSGEEKRAMAETIVTDDLRDIYHCDLLIAYMFRLGAGTSMEIFWANRILRKPVIIIYTRSEDKGRIPLWLYAHSNMIFRTKKAMFEFIKNLLEEDEEDEESEE